MGKTAISTGLMYMLKSRNIIVCGMKPIASGAEITRRGIVSEDAVKLQKLNSVELPYELVNPVVLENPCSPDIASKLENKPIDMDHISECFNTIS
ncbi:MAG: AAA family ATPase, partial [Gammaproteobacteria bacterium]|nr:AAA family ATPase [Gammaproteobacteria bacterium]